MNENNAALNKSRLTSLSSRGALIFSIFLITSTLYGCTQHGGVENVDQLQNLSTSSVSSNGTNTIRLQALQETAMTVGAQAGLAQHAQKLNDLLEKKSSYLDRIFNFHALVLQHNILPPVLVEGRSELTLNGNETIRIADRTYKIISQARFVTAPPNWRDYLSLSFTSPDLPNRTLLPQNPTERTLWKKYVTIGWEEGGHQCDIIYQENLARLKRDFSGMVLYRKLLAQNMVSPPYVGVTSLGVTGGGEEMRVNDQVLRITALPNLKANAKTWKPAVIDP